MNYKVTRIYISNTANKNYTQAKNTTNKKKHNYTQKTNKGDHNPLGSTNPKFYVNVDHPYKTQS